MTMLRFIAVVGVVMLFAGCGADRPYNEGENVVAAPRLEAMSGTPPLKQVATDPAAAGLKVFLAQSGGAVRYDRIREVKPGQMQRQLFVEMLGQTAAETDTLAANVFGEAGFDIRRGLVDENGIRLQYRASGIEPLDVLIRSVEAGPRLEDPKATSSFYLKQSVD